MMAAEGLSVLIPVYNRDVRELTQQLVAQLPAWPGSAEICLLDDGSTTYKEQNRRLAQLPGVRYEELPRNVGRAAVRNRLVAQAQQPWLLLLDNDSYLPDDQFLTRYAAARSQANVLIGGTCYDAAPPADPALYLRWYYGRRREARPAAVRQAEPYGQITINNLLIRADVFRRFGLDESLARYGHEDTKFGWRLREAAVPILHLNNPVRHDGLEPAAVFLEKSRDAVRNLAALYRAEGLGADTKLVQTAVRLQQLGLAPAARLALQAAVPQLRRNLLSTQPRLRAFDALKLYWLLEEWR
ncbi:glycosyltransferase family 2 protein [Hymenobacter busanensis]|uniref:Glycosyltransferase family 2 protein n=1 Tax=Hymenobacter busanensis TaxID=2607656 RepID=A0A7L4ZVD6_9BACT|nr:glycosyltransferase [Hymenobacter busanensis]KAA9339447.1 glycosyltransferase family 2 protein [Hymenobacter busanensis]QHJ06795.1 glycosyltransferase [Hymenobacter busanensis]